MIFKQIIEYLKKFNKLVFFHGLRGFFLYWTTPFKKKKFTTFAKNKLFHKKK